MFPWEKPVFISGSQFIPCKRCRIFECWNNAKVYLGSCCSQENPTQLRRGLATFCDQSRYCQKMLVLQSVFGMVCLSLTWKIKVLVDTGEVEWVVFTFPKRWQSKELGAWGRQGFLWQVTSCWGAGAIPALLPPFCPSHLPALHLELEMKEIIYVRECSGRSYLSYRNVCSSRCTWCTEKSTVTFTSKSSPAGRHLWSSAGHNSGEDLSNTSVFLLKKLLEFSSWTENLHAVSKSRCI